MSLEMARAVADAVLYEGYLLYPYRATSSKNQIRWQFGVLGPPGASSDGVGEASSLHTECLLRAGPGAHLTVQLRCLQLQARGVERADPTDPARYDPVEELAIGATSLLSWDEAVEGSVTLGPLSLGALAAGKDLTVGIAGGEEVELVGGPDGHPAGRVIRRRWPLRGVVHVEAHAVAGDDGVLRVIIHAANTSTVRATDRDEATRVSFLGAHLLLQVSEGAFISLLEPPASLVEAAAACRNERCWPVLVGAEPQCDIVLVSPIILYDYPSVAPESAGALFDSTEIDEILTLRVMTLTDEEKAAARATDPAAAAIIDRCEQMSPEAMQQLHGVLRYPHAPAGGGSDATGPFGPPMGPRGAFGAGSPFGSLDIPSFTTPSEEAVLDGPGPPWWDPGVDGAVSPTTDTVVIEGVAVSKGSRVRLHPRRHADAQDLFFAERTATVSAVYFDVDGATHVAVVLVDDPAADLHEWYGRYLYFAPDEIEPLDRAATATTIPRWDHKGD